MKTCSPQFLLLCNPSKWERMGILSLGSTYMGNKVNKVEELIKTEQWGGGNGSFLFLF